MGEFLGNEISAKDFVLYTLLKKRTTWYAGKHAPDEEN